MSRYVVGKVVYNDLPMLAECLEDIFGRGSVIRCEDGENRTIAYDYHGNNREHEIGKVAAVVHRDKIGPASNDIAIRKERDGTYRLIISVYDEMVLRGRLNVQADRQPQVVIAQRYGVAVVRSKFKALGYECEINTQADGTIRVVGTAQRNW